MSLRLGVVLETLSVFCPYLPSIKSFKPLSAGLLQSHIPKRTFLKSRPFTVLFNSLFLYTFVPSPGIYIISYTSPILILSLKTEMKVSILSLYGSGVAVGGILKSLVGGVFHLFARYQFGSDVKTDCHGLIGVHYRCGIAAFLLEIEPANVCLDEKFRPDACPFNTRVSLPAARLSGMLIPPTSFAQTSGREDKDD